MNNEGAMQHPFPYSVSVFDSSERTDGQTDTVPGQTDGKHNDLVYRELF